MVGFAGKRLRTVWWVLRRLNSFERLLRQSGVGANLRGSAAQRPPEAVDVGRGFGRNRAEGRGNGLHRRHPHLGALRRLGYERRQQRRLDRGNWSGDLGVK